MSDILVRLQAALGDRYSVEREVGSGGMATVYLAQDIRHERSVAIKVLHPDLAATVGADRFEREIRTAAKLQHPHILSLYDSGASSDGLLYYVMPFVQGESLRERLNRDHMLPLDDALRITLEVLDALGHAHAHGIVHRDIKPENVMLANGHALVADFGIARAVTTASDQKLTQTGTAVGTPLYMSPEQSAGDEVGPSSDLYSTACLAYEMLTGSPPFTGANARAIMARHTMDSVPSIRIVRDTVPEEIEDALMWALNKVPADRPATAAQLSEALGTTLGATATRRAPSRMRMTSAGRATMGAGTASGAFGAIWWRRPAVVAVASLLALAGVAATFMAKAGSAGRRAATDGGLDPRSIAVLYFNVPDRDSNLSLLADGLTEGLIDALASVNALHVVSRSGAASVRDRALHEDSIAKLLSAGTLVKGEVERDQGDVRVTVRLVDGADGAEIARASFRRPASEALGLRDSLVDQAASLVRARLGEEIRVRGSRAGTVNSEAWVLLQRAQRLTRRADSLAAAGDTSGGPERTGAQADSIAARAEELDPAWSAPSVARAMVSYRRSRRFTGDRIAARRDIDTGMVHVERAILKNPQDPDALELRGNLQYWKWLLVLEADDARATALLHRAQADLEKAVDLNPQQAGAWATLSHLYNQTKTGTDINIAARNALQADAFLSNADVILQRLFYSSYDLADFVAAQRWCAEGEHRFPGDVRFISCRLYMLNTREKQPDPARAWRLNDSMLAATPEQDTAYARVQGRILVAAVLARAGLKDSARALLIRSRSTADIDETHDLALHSGFVYVLLGDTTEALRDLGVYLAANPLRRKNFADDPGWWYRPVEAHQAFRRLVGAR